VNSFAERLSHARTLRGLSQASLARACKLSQGAIGNYERGMRHSAKRIFKIAEVLQVNAQWLSEGIGPMEPLSSPALTHYELTDPRPPQHVSVWPFQDISPDDYWSLTRDDRITVEQTLIALVASLRKKNLPPTT
jgi:transcriptional regulator with XRE-family HTH domain